MKNIGLWISVLSILAVVMYINRHKNEKYDDKQDSVGNIDPWRFVLPDTRQNNNDRVKSPLIRW